MRNITQVIGLQNCRPPCTPPQLPDSKSFVKHVGVVQKCSGGSKLQTSCMYTLGGLHIMYCTRHGHVWPLEPEGKNCDAGKQYKTPSSIHSCLTHACAGARSMKRSRACSRIPGRVSIQAHDLENWWLRTSRSSPAVLLHTHTYAKKVSDVRHAAWTSHCLFSNVHQLDLLTCFA